MAQTAAQRKAAEEKAQQEQAVADASAPAEEEIDEFAPDSPDSNGNLDAEKLKDIESELAAATEARVELEAKFNEARERYIGLVKQLSDALGVQDDDEKIAQAAVERIASADELNQQPVEVTGPVATAIRISVVEVDGAGVPLRKWGIIVPMSQANPAAVGKNVEKTVEEIIGLPVGPAQALQQEPVD